jgi:hypothetical protein
MCVAVFFLQSCAFGPASVSIWNDPDVLWNSHIITFFQFSICSGRKNDTSFGKNPYVCNALGGPCAMVSLGLFGAVSAFRHIRSRPHQSQNPDRKSEQFEKFRGFVLKIPLMVHTLLRAPPVAFACMETVPLTHQKRQWHSDRKTIFSQCLWYFHVPSAILNVKDLKKNYVLVKAECLGPAQRGPERGACFMSFVKRAACV